MTNKNSKALGSGLFSVENLWPNVTLRECLMYLALYPFIATTAAALSVYTLLAGNIVVVGLHVLDWVKELSVSKKVTERTSVGRERLESFSQHILDSLRTMLILLVLFVLKFSFLAICGTIHAIYAALFKKDGSVVGTSIRWFFNGIAKMLVGHEIFEGPSSAAKHAAAVGETQNDADKEIAGLDDENDVLLKATEAAAASLGDNTAQQASTPATPNAPPNDSETPKGNQNTNNKVTVTKSEKEKLKKMTAEQIRASAAARGLNPNLGSGSKRKTSVAVSSKHNCEVINEGPHFNRVSRGCLLPVIE